MQEEANRLGVDVHNRDGVDLRLRVGLNSGQVIAGEIGSRPFGYTTVGGQVDGPADGIGCPAWWGDAQRSTARLVEAAAVLGELQMVHIKGSDEPVAAGSDPMTVPVISCSRIIASFVV